MSETSQVANSPSSSPETLTIRDCGFSFRASFDRPLTLQSVNTTELTNAFLDTFREQNLSAADITLEKGDSLFGYSIKAHLYSRLITINVSGIGIESTLLRLLTAADRGIGAECIKKTIELFGGALSPNCLFEASVHADFGSSEARHAFFSGHAEGGLELGGVLGYKRIQNEQLIRVQIDQSYAYENGAFIYFTTLGMTVETLLSSDPIWRRYFELTENFALKLKDV